MKKIVITAFDPFGGEVINPASVAVIALPDEIGDTKIIKQELPTVYGKCFDILLPILQAERPDAVICVGQAGGRAGISIERVAINLDDSKMTDNDGIVRTDQPIFADGTAAYFSTLPTNAIICDLHQAEIPAFISNTAGTFVCNHIMYTTLHYVATNKLDMKVGFIHVPYLPAQTLDKPSTPSMSLKNITKGLETIIRTTIDYRGGNKCERNNPQEKIHKKI